MATNPNLIPENIKLNISINNIVGILDGKTVHSFSPVVGRTNYFCNLTEEASITSTKSYDSDTNRSSYTVGNLVTTKQYNIVVPPQYSNYDQTMTIRIGTQIVPTTTVNGVRYASFTPDSNSITFTIQTYNAYNGMVLITS